MALDGTYNGLKASIADWLQRSDLTAAIPDFVTLAESQISRRLLMLGPVRKMMARADATISGEFAAVPDDFMGVRGFYLTSDRLRQLQFCEPEQIIQKKAALAPSYLTGDPRYFAVVGDQFQFFPAPVDTDSFPAEVTYWQRLPTITGGTANWVLTLHPDAYLYGALLQSAPYLVDDARIAVWENAFATVLGDIASADKIERNAPFVAVPYVAGGTP